MAGNEQDRDALADQLGAIALEASRLLRDMQGHIGGHRVKEDGSPTTDADIAAERLIIERLRALMPDVPVVAEESASAASAGRSFFLVDPLDGTKDFMRGGPEYTVNIALVRDGRPVAAAVAAPSLGRIWIAGDTTRAGEFGPDGDEVTWRPVQARPAPAEGLVALVSRRHGDEVSEACLDAFPIAERRGSSSSIKFCLIASGEADIYVRCGPTMEWDTAAGDHVVTAAGGHVIGPDGGPIRYGQADRGYRSRPFAAIGDPTLAQRLKLPESTA